MFTLTSLYGEFATNIPVLVSFKEVAVSAYEICLCCLDRKYSTTLASV